MLGDLCMLRLRQVVLHRQVIAAGHLSRLRSVFVGPRCQVLKSRFIALVDLSLMLQKIRMVAYLLPIWAHNFYIFAHLLAHSDALLLDIFLREVVALLRRCQVLLLKVLQPRLDYCIVR